MKLSWLFISDFGIDKSWMEDSPKADGSKSNNAGDGLMVEPYLTWLVADPIRIVVNPSSSSKAGGYSCRLLQDASDFAAPISSAESSLVLVRLGQLFRVRLIHPYVLCSFNI